MLDEARKIVLLNLLNCSFHASQIDAFADYFGRADATVVFYLAQRPTDVYHVLMHELIGALQAYVLIASDAFLASPSKQE